MDYSEEFEENQFIGRGFLNDGKKEGLWIYFYETGEIEREIEYKNGVEDGSFKLYHKNGQIAVESTHIDGKTVGLFIEYYENGHLKQVTEFINDMGYAIDFWDKDGKQLLINGTGKLIAEYGFTGRDVFEQYFENKIFVKEVRVKGYTVLGFRPKGDGDKHS
jgi:antitoxin component YwqK of YwqJK toxin-antitoxin module